jgi:membrane-associated progesterone receptor component
MEFVETYIQPYTPLILGILSALIVWYFIMGNETSSSTERNDKDVVEDDEPEPTRGFYIEELKKYNGVDNERILMALNGVVYDVTNGRDFYGPEGEYHIFAGRDASRGLAKMSLEMKDVENSSIDDLSLSERDSLSNWCARLEAKYTIAGHIVVPMEKRDYTLEELSAYNGKKDNVFLILILIP